jgi:beta-1,4-mannosyltransferase
MLLRIALFSAWLLGSLLFYVILRRKYAHPKAICVLVLGDLGRSPRMMYHAQSLLENGYIVYLVGYSGQPS